MQETKKINPLIALAAISVILFSIVGVGVMTGLISNSFSKGKESTLETAASKSAAEESKTFKTESPAPKQKTAAKNSSQNTAQAPSQPAVASQEPIKAAAPVCTSCGVVSSVNAISQQGEGSGLGAVAGGVVGGLLGNQVGGGTGKKIATVAGVAGGAYAGHQIEKNAKSSTRYDVIVKMEDGTTQTFSFDSQPAFQPGSKVRVVNGALTAG
jgi:outer membrane lipoprotein SlyB